MSNEQLTDSDKQAIYGVAVLEHNTGDEECCQVNIVAEAEREYPSGDTYSVMSHLQLPMMCVFDAMQRYGEIELGSMAHWIPDAKPAEWALHQLNNSTRWVEWPYDRANATTAAQILLMESKRHAERLIALKVSE